MKALLVFVGEYKNKRKKTKQLWFIRILEDIAVTAADL